MSNITKVTDATDEGSSVASDGTANVTNSLVAKGTSNQSTRDRRTTSHMLITEKVTYTLLL